ncbi:MAG TPA: hypothetical protein VIV11_35045 [Kofleriaceae bacterium]
MTRWWYLAALVPLVIGAVIGILAFGRLIESIEGMQRMVAPGQQAFTLAAGDHIIYAESKSTVDGVAYVNDKGSVKCSLHAADGKAIEIKNHSGKLKYSMSGYSGGAIFDFTMPRDGTATLDCETDEGKVVLAIGPSLAMSIVVGVLPIVLGLVGAVATFFVIRRKRKRYLELIAARDNR